MIRAETAVSCLRFLVVVVVIAAGTTTRTASTCDAFVVHEDIFQQLLQRRSSSTSLSVSELHVPGYAQSKRAFVLQHQDLVVDDGSSSNSSSSTPTLRQLNPRTYTADDSESLIPHQEGYLLHRTRFAICTPDECRAIVDEAERVAAQIAWTTNRHGNFPTTDLPLAELPHTLKFLRVALQERIYPLLQTQFGTFVPDPSKLCLADGFVVKYDAEGGQKELKPHRDGSVVSFNLALNPSSDFDGGGTWFASLEKDGDPNADCAAIKIDQGEIVTHASALLHGGHGITHGKRYILVGFVIVEGYDSWSMRFYNQVRNK